MHLVRRARRPRRPRRGTRRGRGTGGSGSRRARRSAPSTPSLAADPGDERGDARLVREVEAVERLVEQQERRPPRQRLRDEEALLLAARALPDRPRARTPRAPTSSTQLVDAIAPFPPAARASGSGTPQRSPSRPRRTMSTPRIRNDGSKLRRCGRYPISCVRLARRLGRARAPRPRRAARARGSP